MGLEQYGYNQVGRTLWHKLYVPLYNGLSIDVRESLANMLTAELGKESLIEMLMEELGDKCR